MMPTRPRYFVRFAAPLISFMALSTTANAATTPGEPKPEIRPQFVIDIDDVCAGTNQKLMVELARIERNRSTRRVTEQVKNRTARPADVERYTKEIAVPLLREMLIKVRAITLPNIKEGAEFRKIVADFSAGLDALDKNPKLALTNNPLTGPNTALHLIRFDATEKGKRVGFAACGSTDRARFAPPTSVPTTASLG